MLERVLTASVLIATLSAVTVLTISVEMSIVLTVALIVVNVLVSIVDFAKRVLTVKDANEMAEIEKLVALNVSNVAFVPVTVLSVRVDRTVSPLVERVLILASPPVSVLALKVLAVRLLMAALLPTNVLTVNVLTAAFAVMRLGRPSVLVVSVLKIPLVPVNVLMVKVLAVPFDVCNDVVYRSTVLMLLARNELVVRELKIPPDPRKAPTARFVVLNVDTVRTLLTDVRGEVIAMVEPDVIDIALTLERNSVFRLVY